MLNLEGQALFRHSLTLCTPRAAPYRTGVSRTHGNGPFVSSCMIKKNQSATRTPATSR
jgi:hypothetical protein